MSEDNCTRQMQENTIRLYIFQNKIYLFDYIIPLKLENCFKRVINKTCVLIKPKEITCSSKNKRCYF